jgi:DnaK suppressor protein
LILRNEPGAGVAYAGMRDTMKGAASMDRITEPDAAALRELLVQRRSQLRAEIDAVQHVPPLADAAGREVTDRKDEAMQRDAATIGDAEARRDRKELMQVEAALRRWDAGDFGVCADCGEPIPRERLRVQPAALRCAACQTAHEGRPAAQN